MTLVRLPRIDRLSWRIGVSVAGLVLGALAAGSFLVYRMFGKHLVAVTRSHLQVESWLVGRALEHDMLTRDRTLIKRMVESLPSKLPVQRVLILDRRGLVQVSSDPSIGKMHFRMDGPTCQGCHQHPVARRMRSILVEAEGGHVLRSVQPIANKPACHSCHDPKDKLNGLLIVDVPLQQTSLAVKRATQRMTLVAGGLGLLLLGGIGLAMRRLILRRLIRFEATARAIAEGDLERRVPIEGSDALTHLEIQFNQMADSIGQLLGEVQQQRKSLENVMNSVDDGMVVLDRARTVVASNLAFARRLGRQPADLVGRACCRSAGPDGASSSCLDAGPDECPVLSCFSTGRVATALRQRTAADGTLRQEEVRASPVRGAGGAITHVVEVWRDITDRRSAEARLADYQRMVSLGMLASGFSHEVNTPLASVTACLAGIERACQEGKGEAREQVADYARTAHAQIERCGAITRQFLHLARGQALSREILDLRESAASIARLVAPTAREAGVTIEVEPAPPGFPSVVANGSAVQQVLLNLLLNAIHASAPGHRVRILFRAEQGAPEVAVQDEGRGIAPEDLPRVFEPFFSRREHGTGLGLFVSLNFARGWGGDIRAESQPGVATTFTAVFPRREGA